MHYTVEYLDDIDFDELEVGDTITATINEIREYGPLGKCSRVTYKICPAYCGDGEDDGQYVDISVHDKKEFEKKFELPTED